MEPITAGLSSLLSMFGLEGLLGSTAAAGTAAAAPGATAGASGLGLTAGTGAPALTAQIGAGTSLFAPQATAAMGASSAAAPAYTDIAIKMGGLEGIKKAGTSLMDPNMALQDKFNAVAPEFYKQNQQGQASFAQLQQGAQPMQMPSYARQSMPFQGGGIEEILQRQRGLLR
jgi:IMP dehydrogenase/GMP reductase